MVTFSYKGYVYEPIQCVSDDNAKIEHRVVTPSYEQIYLDHSPYSYMTSFQFQQAIEQFLVPFADHGFVEVESYESVRYSSRGE